MSLIRYLIPAANIVYCQDDWRNVCSIVNPCIFRLEDSKKKIGCTGFFINSSGYGISTYHFYSQLENNASNCKLYYKGKEYSLEIVSVSEEVHSFIIKAKGIGRTSYLKFAEDSPKLGSQVSSFCINPSFAEIFEPGYILDLTLKGVTQVDFECIRCSCKSVAGYSGGPVINREGLVVGTVKSYSNLYDFKDTIVIPTPQVTAWLSSIAKYTQDGWQF